MPLTRGRPVGHDEQRLAFLFSMLNGDRPARCQISDAAMDELLGLKGTTPAARQALFLEHRDHIERIASEIFDASNRRLGAVVRIFTKHVI
jgi:hypothetical protein